MHLDDAVSHALILAVLYASEQLHGNPLLLALQQGSHDFGDAILIQGLRFDIVDIFFIVFADLLLTGSFGHGGVPGVPVFNAKGFDRDVGQLGRTFGLSLATKETCAIGFAAITRLRVCPIPIDVVVEHQFFSGVDSALGKDAHPQLFANDPFVHVTVGIARMIAEPAQITFLGRVDEHIFLQGHEVEVLDALIVVLVSASLKGSHVDHITDVLIDESVGLDIRIGTKTVSFFLRFDDRHRCVLMVLEALILAVGATAAISHTFDAGEPVHTVRIRTTRVVGPC